MALRPFLLLIACWRPAWAYQAADPVRTQVENLTVMIDAYFADDPNPEWGTGIIASLRGSTLNVLTATHVYQPRASVTAKRVGVRLRWLPTSRVLDASSVRAEGDLGVLEVNLPPDAIPSPDTLLFSSLGDSASLSHEEVVRPLGHAPAQYPFYGKGRCPRYWSG